MIKTNAVCWDFIVDVVILYSFFSGFFFRNNKMTESILFKFYLVCSLFILFEKYNEKKYD